MDTQAAEILKLIETVDPSDTTKMDEIDARVWCWLHKRQYEEYKIRDNPVEKGRKYHIESMYLSSIHQYTRSRDSLKSIRPEGWSFRCHTSACEALRLSERRQLLGQAATEELAELHAIIQAIEYERSKKNG